MIETIQNISWAMIFSIVGGMVGMAMVIASTMILPALIDKLTPNLDEQKEIARGNTAVGEYFGRVVAAAILGVSIVAAASVLGGIIAALH
jgi:uncharacterized membrane protein YjfL (UPF0719 family)